MKAIARRSLFDFTWGLRIAPQWEKVPRGATANELLDAVEV